MKKHVSSFFAIALYCISYLALAAPEAKPLTLADTWVMVPKSGQSQEFEDAFKKHLKFRAKQGDPHQWLTYAPTLGDNLNHYIVRYCCTSFKNLDAYDKWAKKSKVGEHWQKHVAKYVESYEHYYNRLDIKNSHWPNSDKMFTYYGVTSYKAKMGMGKSIEDAKAKLSEVAKDMKWPYSWSWGWQIGGKEGMSLVVGYDDYNAMTPPEVSFMEAFAKQTGDEKATQGFFKSWSENFHSTKYTIYKYHEELSMSK